ncbi:MAG TPA: protein kinase [Rheinheimera sp.]|uniref:protein kinase domain-containing protein n=1 Tax=Rheinheimera sp. TaxID=1869214 RepID=UPI002F923847
MALQLTVGQYSCAGRKALNQDHCAANVPAEPLLSNKGAVLALADGVSSSSVSQLASETAVKSFLADYYCTSEAWSVRHAGMQVLKACHHWLHGQNRNSPYGSDPDKGYTCTFSSLILRQQHAHLLHVGDSRIYLLRQQQLAQLTRDHRVWRGSQSYLSQALGASAELNIDYHSLPLQQGDVFLLATDGLFETLPQPALLTLLNSPQPNLNALAQQLAEAALAAGSDDNISLQLVRVDAVPQQSTLPGYVDEQLPLPPLLQSGDTLDGLTVIRPLQQNSRSHVYLVQASGSDKLMVLKAPSTEMAEQPAYLEQLMREEWIAKRVNNPHIMQAASHKTPRTALYTLFDYIEGQTLRQWQLDQPKPTLEQVRNLIEQTAKGLQALHRSEILHQDIRPENLLLTSQGLVKIIDFGAARLSGLQTDNDAAGIIPGTALYCAPEYFLGAAGTESADQFSLAVLTYQLLSGQFPYGPQVARCRSLKAQKKLRYQPLSATEREDLPAWLDFTLQKALQPDPAQRYQALSEFIYDLRQPNPAFQAPKSLLQLHPLWFWQSCVLAQSLVILWLLARQG